MKLFAILITTVFFIIIMFFPSFASDPIENETVLDTTSFNVWELGLSVKKDSTTMLGSPKSKNYSRWIDNVQYFSPDHMIVNTLSRVVHTIEQHVITRDCAYIGSDFEKCINFIQRELKTIAHLIKQQDLSKKNISLSKVKSKSTASIIQTFGNN